MEYPLEYIDFLVHFHSDRDYFECHEILEEYWKETGNRNKNSIWVGLIQLAVANYHHRRGNFIGASRTLQKSFQNFSLNKVELSKLGIDPISLTKQINNQLIRLDNSQNYRSMNIPILSKSLVEKCKNRCQELNMEWFHESDLNNLQIVHRHMNRDRTDVIDARNKALQKKRIKGSDL